MRITKEQFDDIIRATASWGIQQDIILFKYTKTECHLLITLNEDTSAIEQGGFELELSKILFNSDQGVYTVTRAGLDKSVEAHKITASEKNKILEKATQEKYLLNNFVIDPQEVKISSESTQAEVAKKKLITNKSSKRAEKEAFLQSCNHWFAGEALHTSRYFLKPPVPYHWTASSPHSVLHVTDLHRAHDSVYSLRTHESATARAATQRYNFEKNAGQVYYRVVFKHHLPPENNLYHGWFRESTSNTAASAAIDTRKIDAFSKQVLLNMQHRLSEATTKRINSLTNRIIEKFHHAQWGDIFPREQIIIFGHAGHGKSSFANNIARIWHNFEESRRHTKESQQSDSDISNKGIYSEDEQVEHLISVMKQLKIKQNERLHEELKANREDVGVLKHFLRVMIEQHRQSVELAENLQEQLMASEEQLTSVIVQNVHLELENEKLKAELAKLKEERVLERKKQEDANKTLESSPLTENDQTPDSSQGKTPILFSPVITPLLASTHASPPENLPASTATGSNALPPATSDSPSPASTKTLSFNPSSTSK